MSKELQKNHYVTRKTVIEDARKRFYEHLKTLMKGVEPTGPEHYISLHSIVDTFENLVQYTVNSMVKEQAGKIASKPKRIFRPRRLWSKEEDAIVVQNYRLKKNREIARMLNRSELAISQRACTLGISRKKESTSATDEVAI